MSELLGNLSARSLVDCTWGAGAAKDRCVVARDLPVSLAAIGRPKIMKSPDPVIPERSSGTANVFTNHSNKLLLGGEKVDPISRRSCGTVQRQQAHGRDRDPARGATAALRTVLDVDGASPCLLDKARNVREQGLTQAHAQEPRQQNDRRGAMEAFRLQAGDERNDGPGIHPAGGFFSDQ